MTPVLAHLLDRLVDGELGDAERRRLLVQLDDEPDGWRHCALAFLEAQEMRLALRSAASVAMVPKPALINKSARRRRSLARAIALAALMLLAFSTGWAVRDRGERMVPLAANRHEAESAPNPEDPTPPIAVARTAPPVADPVVQLWEQKGYLAERQQRLVNVQLRDGRKVQVAVEEVRLRDVRGRSF